ncbi:hypothetical protein N1851_019823 [Merluccius polli]|uniref:Uncharacterized protein n=1 Tax=Merluccius polli TaxID=89951 RepID=A0AA47NXH4_MERPO|nr:hypothetical protein N1851_019823 [Merluccius polli]
MGTPPWESGFMKVTVARRWETADRRTEYGFDGTSGGETRWEKTDGVVTTAHNHNQIPKGRSEDSFMVLINMLLFPHSQMSTAEEEEKEEEEDRDRPSLLWILVLAVPSAEMVKRSRRHSMVAGGLDDTSQLMFTGLPSHEYLTGLCNASASLSNRIFEQFTLEIILAANSLSLPEQACCRSPFLGSVNCERVFSTMNRVKADLKNRLQGEHLGACMKISINGPPVAKFPYHDAMVTFFSKPRKIKCSNESCTLCSWCANVLQSCLHMLFPLQREHPLWILQQLEPHFPIFIPEVEGACGAESGGVAVTEDRINCPTLFNKSKCIGWAVIGGDSHSMSRNMLFWWPPIRLRASQSKRPRSASRTLLIVNIDLPWRPRTSKRPSWLCSYTCTDRHTNTHTHRFRHAHIISILFHNVNAVVSER